MYRLPPISDIDYLLESAQRIDDAVGACLQVVEDKGRAIRIVLARGLKPEYFDRFRIVRSGFRTSCAQAFTERRRVVIRDVTTDKEYAELCDIAVEAGYRSVQTTPLIDEDRNFHGLFSTYFAMPHHPGPDSLRELDRHAHAAMLVLQAHMLRDALLATDRHLGINGRAMPASGAHAAEAAGRLLPTVARGNQAGALDHLISSLETVVKQLRDQLKQHRSVAASPATDATTTAVRA